MCGGGGGGLLAVAALATVAVATDGFGLAAAAGDAGVATAAADVGGDLAAGAAQNAAIDGAAATAGASGAAAGTAAEGLAAGGEVLPAATTVANTAATTGLPATVADGGAMDTFGARAVPMDPSSAVINGSGAPGTGSGLIDRVIQWGKENPRLGAAGMIAGGQLVAGAGAGAGAYLASKRKAESDMALLEKQKENSIELATLMPQITQAANAGPTNLNIGVGDTTLTRPGSGEAVYGKTGLVRRAMNA